MISWQNFVHSNGAFDLKVASIDNREGMRSNVVKMIFWRGQRVTPTVLCNICAWARKRELNEKESDISRQLRNERINEKHKNEKELSQICDIFLAIHTERSSPKVQQNDCK